MHAPVNLQLIGREVAIVSDDGMLAEPSGHMPDSLKFDADQTFFRDGMDRCDVAIHGRHSHEHQPNSPKRHRIWVTGRVNAVERKDGECRVLLWNPAGASFIATKNMMNA